MAFGGVVKIVDIQVVSRAAGSDGDSFFALEIYGPETDVCRTNKDSSARKQTLVLRAKRQIGFLARAKNFCKALPTATVISSAPTSRQVESLC